MREQRTPALLAAVAVAVGMTAAVGTASAGHVGCGTVVTANTTLHGDVGPCPAGGIIVGADNITLDLNGHRVFGVAGVPNDGIGIELRGRSGVTVRDGTVSDFDAGVAIIAGGFNVVTGITARDNVSALGVGDWGDGIALQNSRDNLITGNVAERNGPYDGIGLFGVSFGNTISNNVVRNNNIPTSATTNQDDGIRLEPFTFGNTVTGNVVEGSGLDGIAVFARSTGNTVSGNTVRNNGFHDRRHRWGDGIRVFSTGNETLVEGNSVFGNAASGIRVDAHVNVIRTNLTGGNDAAPDVMVKGGDLVVVTATTRVQLTVAGNSVDTHVPPRTPAYDLYDTNPGCDANTWSGNTYGTAFPDCTKA